MLIEAKSLAALGGVTHGFFTREGGVSHGIYGSLNTGIGSRDDPANVAENRRRVSERMGTLPERLLSPYQTHSPDVIVAEEPWRGGERPRGDAIVTARRGLAIAVSTADCVPVLFADERAEVVGAAHAGWRGALAGVLEAAVAAMERLGAERTGIRAAIGPAISLEAYEVGEEFEQRFLEEDAENKKYFLRPATQSRPCFDLPGYVADRLRRARLGAIEELGVCTYAEESRFFSYRRSVHRAEPDYGRQISAILLPR